MSDMYIHGVQGAVNSANNNKNIIIIINANTTHSIAYIKDVLLHHFFCFIRYKSWSLDDYHNLSIYIDWVQCGVINYTAIL